VAFSAGGEIVEKRRRTVVLLSQRLILSNTVQTTKPPHGLGCLRRE
jgi:hypothetical protein